MDTGVSTGRLEVYVSDVGGGSGVTVGLVLAGRGGPPRRLPVLSVWDRDSALLDHIVDHLFNLFEACLEAVLLQEKTKISYSPR